MKIQIVKQNVRGRHKIRQRCLFASIGAVIGATIGIALLMLGGCKSQKQVTTDTQQESAIVDYTCIANPDSESKIYVILKNYHGAYWESVIDGVTEAAEKIDAAVYLGGIDNETAISEQISLVDQAIEEGADGILLAPASSDELVPSCKKAREHELSVVLIDSSINSGDFDACFMTDNMGAGETAAKEMLQMLKEAGNPVSEPLEVGIVLSSDTSQAMVNRVSGFLDYWANYAPVQWEIAQDIYVNGGNVKKAQSNVSTLLSDHENLKGIFGCNNTSTIGIANTLTKEKRSDVVMVGFDMAEETRQIIEDSNYRAVTLLQKQDEMGYRGILSLDSLIKGEASEQKYFDTGIVLIDSHYLTQEGAS